MNKHSIFNKRRFIMTLGLVGMLLAASATLAFAQTALAGDGSISACVLRDGTLYISNALTCKRSETLLTWNIAGPQGPQGAKGDAGDPGAIGPQGPIGLTGPQGEAGPAGPQGPAGATGAQGEPGLEGAKGEPGAAGQSAYEVARENGFLGDVSAWLASLVGPKGDKGDQGLQGAQGERGLQGVAGPQGPKGDTGATGAAGPQGSAGLTGPQGEPGLAGPEGPQGPQGIAGLAGTDGLACWDLNGNSKPDLEEDINGDTSFDVHDCQGAQGEAGPQGPAGATGPQGPIGLTGATGPVGPQGPQGEPGPGVTALDSLQGIACNQGSQLPGVLEISYDATGGITMRCVPTTTYPLNVTIAGDAPGKVTSNPAGIDCASDCSEEFVWGSLVTLTPTPDYSTGNENIEFVEWSGDCRGSGACVVTMDRAKNVTAIFRQYVTISTIIHSIPDATNGALPWGVLYITAPRIGGTSCGSAYDEYTTCDDIHVYPSLGEDVQLRADTYYGRFEMWESTPTGICTGNSQYCGLIVTEYTPTQIWITATFTP